MALSVGTDEGSESDGWVHFRLPFDREQRSLDDARRALEYAMEHIDIDEAE
jgi:hypothetical protein